MGTNAVAAHPVRLDRRQSQYHSEGVPYAGRRGNHRIPQRRKSCVTVDEEKIQRIRSSLLAKDTQSLVISMKQMGISKDEALALVEAAWREEEQP